MINNDVLRSVRFMLNVDDAKLAVIIKLGGMEVTRPQVTAFLKREEEPGYAPCDNVVMAHFLDGLISHYVLDGGALDIEWRADNHVVMTGPSELNFTGELSDRYFA